MHHCSKGYCVPSFAVIFILLLLLQFVEAVNRDLTPELRQTTPNPVVTGAPVNFTLTVRNLGTNPANNVLVRVTLPIEFRFSDPASSVGGPDFSCVPAGVTAISCTTDQIAAGGTRQFNFNTVAPSAVSGNSQSFTSQATADPNNTVNESNETNNSSTASTTVQFVEAVNRDLTTELRQTTPNPALTGAPVNFTLTVRNLGTNAANNVLVRVTLPKEFRFSDAASSVGGPDFSCVPAGVIAISCTTNQIAAGGTRQFSFKTATPSAVSGSFQSFTSQATADPNNTVNESNEINNRSTASTTLVERPDFDPDLVGSATTADLGLEMTYVLKVTNKGDAFGNPTLRATLPQGVEFRRFEQNSLGGCRRDGGVIECLAPLAPGESRGTRIIAQVLNVNVGAQVSFAVNVDFENQIVEKNENNNTAFVITTVRNPPDLRLTASVSGGCGGFGLGHKCNFLVNVRVHNDGPGASPPTLLRLTLPPGYVDGTTVCDPQVSFLGASDERCFGINPPESPCAASCNVPAIAAGASRVFLIAGQRPNDDTDNTFNIPLLIDANNAVVEKNENNNQVTVTITQ